jgi:hypothetical protein
MANCITFISAKWRTTPRQIFAFVVCQLFGNTCAIPVAKDMKQARNGTTDDFQSSYSLVAGLRLLPAEGNGKGGGLVVCHALHGAKHSITWQYAGKTRDFTADPFFVWFP